MNKLNNCKRFVEIVLDEIGREQARGVMLEDIDVDAVIRRVKWMDDSGHSHVPAGGVGPFRTDPVEYEVVSVARAAIAKAEGTP